MNFFTDIYERHERLKKRIHSFRMPLSPAGQKGMAIVYFTIPIVIGFYIMQAAKGQADVNLGKDGSKITNSIEGESIARQHNQALQQMLDKHNPNKK